MESITLSGCAPVPLAHYLKALGILRLVSEQKDSTATGRWHRDQFILTSSLDREGLLKFFSEEYSPTPVLSPWNAGSGFYFQEEKLNKRDPRTDKKIKTGVRNQETAATRVVSEILRTEDPRLETYRKTIRQTKELLTAKGLISAPDTSGADKDELVLELRSIWPDSAVEWLDCVAVLISSRNAKSKTGLKPSYTTLLGSGANDGNADFTSNFMQRLAEILNASDSKKSKWLETSLFGDNNPSSKVAALAGQYSPGTAGGANSTAGFAGNFSINPWDYILLIEGTLFFAAAAMRQHNSNSDGTIAYPFCVVASGVGYASASIGDEKAGNSLTEEMWLPLWSRNSSREELKAIFGEGRVQLRGKNAKNGVDFAQAVCSMGADVGLDSFQRVGFFVRNGKSVFATPLTRVIAKKNAGVDLLCDIDDWLNSYRRAANKETAPASVVRALKVLESRIFILCVRYTPEHLLAVFVALGQCEKAAAKSLKWSASEENYLKPLQGLRAIWIDQAWNHSTEFRLAASLASIAGKFGKEWLPLRCHLECVAAYPKKSEEITAFDWAENDKHVCWSDASLPDVLNDILARRLILNEDTEKRFELWSSLSDIKAFIDGETDNTLLANLIWSMSLINWRERAARPSEPRERQPVPPTLYAMLKLCFPPVQKELPDDVLAVPVVPSIHRHAAQGRGIQASEGALRRLRASGYRPIARQLLMEGDRVKRTAAALLFPISNQTLKALVQQTTRPEKELESSTA